MQQTADIDLVQILRLLYRQIWLILAVIFVLMTAASAMFLRLPHLYTAEATVVLNSRSSKIADMQSALSKPLSGLQSDSAVIRTEIESIKSAELVQRVIDEKRLMENPEFNRHVISPSDNWFAQLKAYAKPWMEAARTWIGSPASPAPAIDDMTATLREVQRRLSVVNDGGSYLLKIQFEAENPQVAAEVANSFAEIYLRDQQTIKLATTRDAAAWLKDRISELQEKVLSSERALLSFREENHLAEVNGSTLIDREIAEVTSQVVAASADVKQKEASAQELQSLQQDDVGLAGSSVVLASPLVQRLREQEAALEDRYTELSTQYGKDYPVMANIRAQKAQIARKISGEIGKFAGAARGDAGVAKVKLDSLQTQLDALQQQRANLTGAEVQMRVLEREAAANRTLHASYLEKFKEVSAQEHSQEPDARLLSIARPPLDPSSPRYFLLVPAALVGSTMVAVILALIYGWFRYGFTSAEAIEEFGPIRSFGLLPELGRRTHPMQHLLQEPRARFPEAVQSVYAALQCLDRTDPPKVVMITSSLPEEGKSVFAASLARSMALTGRRTLLIDLDLRRPTQAALLEAKNCRDLSSQLDDMRGLGDLVQTDLSTGLDYVAVRRERHNIAAILSSQRLRDLIDAARDRYDHVVIDSPPILAVSDALLVSALVDTTLLVVRWERTPRSVVRNTLKILGDNNVPLAGVLLTRVNMRKHARYSYGDASYFQRQNGSY